MNEQTPNPISSGLVTSSRMARFVVMACLLLLANSGFSAESPATSVSDELTVQGDIIRGRVIAIETNVIRFHTIYGHGEVFIPLRTVESWKHNGIDQTLPPSDARERSSAQSAAPEPETASAQPLSNPNSVAGTNVLEHAAQTNEVDKAGLAQISPDSIDAQIEEAQELQQSWIERLPHRKGIRYFNKANNWLDEKIRLRLGMAYTSLAIGASDRLFGDQGAAAGDFDVFGRWRLWGESTGNTGTIGFNLRHRHRYTRTAPSRLGVHLGSGWNVTSGFSDTGFELTQAYLDQYFLDRNVGFRIGQMFQDLHFDTYSFKSEKLYFLNAAFSDNPAVVFPGAGVGFATLIRPVPDWYLITGVGDAQERKLDSGLDALFSEKLFSGIELGWHPSTGPLKHHSFSLFTWFTPASNDGKSPDGDGFTLTYEWKPEHNFSLFARYAWSGTRATLVTHLGTAGVVFRKPFGREQDFLGVAFAWGVPTEERLDIDEIPGLSDVNGRSQGVLEVFHRFQVTPLLQITPDVQLLIRPAYNTHNDLIAVFGIRARVAL